VPFIAGNPLSRTDKLNRYYLPCVSQLGVLSAGLGCVAGNCANVVQIIHWQIKLNVVLQIAWFYSAASNEGREVTGPARKARNVLVRALFFYHDIQPYTQLSYAIYFCLIGHGCWHRTGTAEM